MLGRVVPVAAAHAGWKVRLCVAKTAGALLVACGEALASSVSILVDALVTIQGDAYESVAAEAR